MQELTGKKIVALFANPGRTELRFATDPEDQSLGYAAEGDCCSSSWFEHISGLDYLIGGTIRGVQELPEWVDPVGKRDDQVVVYGWYIHTERGTCHIEMRNGSNGYYGGSAVLSRAAVANDPVTEDF